MNQRPVVLLSTTHYLPGFRAGGPIKSVQAIVERLGDEFDFRLVTEDRDLKVENPYEGIRQNQWNSGNRCAIFYRSADGPAMKEILAGLDYDLLYLNSFFAPIFSVSALRAHRAIEKKVPVLIAPRGEFQIDALKHKHKRKKLFLSATKALGWYRSVIWHAASEQEKSEIQRVWGSGANIYTALDAMPRIDPQTLAPLPVRKVAEPFRVVFLGRISPVKNLIGAIEAFSGLSVPAKLTVYGPEEDPEYVRACKAAAANLPKHLQVHFAGLIQPNSILDSLVEHDAMLFPSTGESFGHVIGEGLVAGLPVVLSDRTPWSWVERKGVGFVSPLSDTERMGRNLSELAGLSPERFDELRAHCRLVGMEAMQNDSGIEDTRRMFEALLRDDH